MTSWDGRLLHRVRKGRFTFLLDESDGTAAIEKGRTARWRRLRLPESVTCLKRTFVVNEVLFGAFKTGRLRHVVIPDSYSFVDECNFSFTDRLRSIQVGKGLSFLNSWIFPENKRLRRFTIDEGNPHLMIQNGIVVTRSEPKRALWSIFDRKVIDIPEGTAELEATAFWYNSRCEEVRFPSSLRVIRDNSLSYCPLLRRIDFPEGMRILETQTLNGCDALEEVSFPSTMEDLGWVTFHGCPSLRRIILHSGRVLKNKRLSLFDDSVDMDRFTLAVPGHLVDAYRKDSSWAMVRHIEAISSGDGSTETR